MKQRGIIFILMWILFRLVFHSFSFDNSEIVTFMYFGGNNLANIGFLLIILDNLKIGGWIPLLRFRKVIKSLIIYACWCMVVDVLMLAGIGTHDFVGYTAISILLLICALLWIFV